MEAKGDTRGVFKAPARRSKVFLSAYFGVIPRPPKEVVTGQRSESLTIFSPPLAAWILSFFSPPQRLQRLINIKNEIFIVAFVLCGLGASAVRFLIFSQLRDESIINFDIDNRAKFSKIHFFLGS